MVVFPAEDLPRPRRARCPTSRLLRRVAAYLDPRRLVTTELYVIPPDVPSRSRSRSASRVREGYQVDAVRRWVELILRQYLAPLPPYGPDGAGLAARPRRAPRRAEAVAVQVEGVEFLEDDLLLARAGRRRRASDRPGRPGRAASAWEVPELVGDHRGRPGPPLPPGAGTPPPPDARATRSLVPLPPEVC